MTTIVGDVLIRFVRQEGAKLAKKQNRTHGGGTGFEEDMGLDWVSAQKSVDSQEATVFLDEEAQYSSTGSESPTADQGRSLLRNASRFGLTARGKSAASRTRVYRFGRL